MMDVKTICGERIRQLRQSQNMSQKDFADLINVRQNTISQYEKGVAVPSLDVLILIANKFEVSLDWLAGRSDDMKAGQKSTTYEELIRLIVRFLSEKGKIPFFMGGGIEYEFDDEARRNGGMPYLVKSYTAKIEFRDIVLAQFFDEWNTMHKLVNDGTISKDIYNSWFEGKALSLKGVKYLESDDDIYEQIQFAEFYKNAGANYSYTRVQKEPFNDQDNQPKGD